MKLIPTIISIALLVTLTSAGCEKSAEPTAATEPAIVSELAEFTSAEGDKAAPASLLDEARRLATLRDAIKAAPDNVDALMKEAGLTDEQLEELLFRVAADPEASALFSRGR